MTVEECIETYKDKATRRNHKMSRLWLCPQLVKNPKVGTDYAIEVAITTKLEESLLKSQVTKNWVEGEVLCIAYKCDEHGNPTPYIP